MPLEIVGSTEALLRLVASYQGSNCRRAHPLLLWSRISEYVTNGGAYNFYPASDYDPHNPGSGFLSDLANLVAAGHLAPLPNGAIEVTVSGSSIASMLRLPRSLMSLESHLTATETTPISSPDDPDENVHDTSHT